MLPHSANPKPSRTRVLLLSLPKLKISPFEGPKFTLFPQLHVALRNTIWRHASEFPQTINLYGIKPVGGCETQRIRTLQHSNQFCTTIAKVESYNCICLLWNIYYPSPYALCNTPPRGLAFSKSSSLFIFILYTLFTLLLNSIKF